jgi:cytochrome c peroxidase
VFSFCIAPSFAQFKLPNLFPFPNAHGISQTYNKNGNGQIDLGNAFFQSLGTNGRSCSSCHQPDQGWGISSSGVALRFLLSAGLDPIFRTVDGSVCDHGVNTSTFRGRQQAYKLLTDRGLLRIGIDVPAGAQFDVVSVSNPYGCNETTTISTYRRPLPATNLRFLSAVMWDGRESTPPSTQKITPATNPADLIADLGHQAQDATAGHAQGTKLLTQAQIDEIVNFEFGLYTAQGLDYGAGSLSAGGAKGGADELTDEPFFVGINDPLGGNPTGAPFTPAVFHLYDAWSNFLGLGGGARAAIARGQALFNSKAINITGVGGLNDALGQTTIAGTCGTCHDSPNTGDHSLAVPLNIGVSDLTNPLGVGYLPVVTLKNKATGAIIQTTDPGRALITGQWADIGKVKGPVLRGLAARAPYFHNGSAKTLDDVVDFYDTRFGIGLTAQEKADLVAFLNTL